MPLIQALVDDVHKGLEPVHMDYRRLRLTSLSCIGCKKVGQLPQSNYDSGVDPMCLLGSPF